MKRTRVQNKVAELFSLDSTGRKTPKGWYLTAEECPFCNKDQYHMGIKFNEDRSKFRNHIIFNCFKCQESGTEWSLLKKMGLISFLQDGDFISQKAKPIELTNRIELFIDDKRNRNKVKDIDLSVPTQKPPLGYKRTLSDPYLNSRGFEEWQYNTYNVGRTKVSYKLRNYVIVLVEEDGENKGYLARHIWSKKKLKEHKEKTGQDLPRYANQGGIDFEKLLLGIDEVNEGTKTVILVEGAFDKFNVDSQLQLNTQDEIKCLCTFGKKMSEAQIEKIRRKGVKNIVLLYDNDAVLDQKKYGDLLQRTFKKVRICHIPADDDRDAGDFDSEELTKLILNAQDPVNYRMSKVQKNFL